MNSAAEEIKSRLNAVDVIGEYVQLQKAGANWRACCPFHNEKSPSFMVSEEKQIWHCFGCGKGGDILGFVMEIEGLVFKEALKLLADKAGVQLPQYNSQETSNKNRTLEILELATKFYEKQLWDGAGKEKILGYLKKRGLNENSIKEFRLGYAPEGWRNIVQFLMGRGYSIGEINKTGLLVEKKDTQISNNQFPISKQIPNSNDQNPKVTSCYDRFRDRIMFPIADFSGKTVGFSARVAPGGDESQAKYVNTPETEVYHKSRILYGINKAKQEIKSKDFALLVEGNMDVIAAHQAGIKNAIAVSGTALTPEQLDIIKRYTGKIKMFFDADAAGQAAARKSAAMAFQKEFNLEIVRAGEGKDAAEISAKDSGALLKLVEKSVPAMEYFLEKYFQEYGLGSAEGKKKIAHEILSLISNFSNEIEKGHWLQKLSRDMDIEERILRENLQRIGRRERTVESREEMAVDNIPQKNRLELIREKIIGLMLANPLVWEKIAEYNSGEDVAYLKSDKLFGLLREDGKKNNFQSEKLIAAFGESDFGKIARRLFFESKFQPDGQGGVREIEITDSWELAQTYLNELGKEIKKKKLKVIEADIKKAEKDKDQEAKKFLMEEFSKLSKS